MDTIKSSAEISALFTSGKRYKTPYVTLIVGKRTTQENIDEMEQHDLSGRVAFIAGKKLGNAVWRNSAKRRMRAVCFDLKGPWDNYDVIFLAKSSLTRVSYQKVLESCRSACEKFA